MGRRSPKGPPMYRPAIPCIIDVEASGFGGTSYPIEIGVALDDGERFCSLIRPEPDWTHWSEQAEATHGISRRQLATFGKPAIEVASRLNALLDGMTLYTDGWVVDKPWLITLFHAAHQSMRFHVSPLDMILTEAQMDAWHATKQAVLDDAPLPRHRASHDAWLIQETYRRTSAITATTHVARVS